jgi:uncharacterized DUF497 family protein
VLELRDAPQIFEWDEINAAHMRTHGMWDWEIDQLLANFHVVASNRQRRSPRRFLIGRTNGGKAVTVVIEKTREPGTFRPITAWLSTGPERAALEKGERTT